METLPEIGQQYQQGSKLVRITRVTAISGLYRWIYYRDINTNEFHCQRLDAFLKLYSVPLSSTRR
jgi:hypothetical protein